MPAILKSQTRSRQKTNRALARAGVNQILINDAVSLCNAAFVLRQRRVARLDPADIHQAAKEAAPVRIDESAWPGEVRELAEKIVRGQYEYVFGGLRPFERAVTNADRDLLTKQLPRGLEVNRNDVSYTA